MKFHTPLLKGTLIKRYKRFLADVELEDGTVTTAHCANPGSMLGLKQEGSVVWLSPATNPSRKLKFTWELIEIDGHKVGINTAHPNKIAFEAISSGQISELKNYSNIQQEVKYGKNSRIDLLLNGDNLPDCYVEVKNVHLKRGDCAEFPDSVTARGTKHLYELVDMVKQGHKAVMLYIVQRSDCSHFDIARDIDPTYNEAFNHARKHGVEMLCYSCVLNNDGIELDKPLKIRV